MQSAPRIRILLIDNYDSFTYNLAQALAALGAEVAVARNDRLDVAAVLGAELSGLVLSPGPGRPEDAGICAAALQALDAVDSPLPVLGVCLGHQVIAQVYGAQVVRAARPIHGEIWEVLPGAPEPAAKSAPEPAAKSAPELAAKSVPEPVPEPALTAVREATSTSDPLWEGVVSPLRVTRYHSLVVDPASLPSCLEATAHTSSGEIMALRHRHRPRWGVQFHPESIGSPQGPLLLRNWLRSAGVGRDAGG